jgi:diguanylate cyclase (GGDEF)-like protein
MDIAPFERAVTRRRSALDALGLLDTAPEQEFDAIARLAGVVTGCPTAMIALVDRERLWAKARIGKAPAELPRGLAFCDTTVREDRALIVDDLTRDPRFASHPLVAAGARFYAGLPIHAVDSDGVRQSIGTLCVLDSDPRSLSNSQRAALDDLAALVDALIAARGVARRAVTHTVALERQQRVFGVAERMARIGWWRLDLSEERVEWSDGVFRIHDLDSGVHPSLAAGLDFYPPDARAVVSRSLAHTIETGQPFDLEVDFVSATGVKRRVRSMGEIEWIDGVPAALIGVFRDCSEEHALTQALRRSADTDPLTHIDNRAAFNRRLEDAIAVARAESTPLALVLIDLDGFKRINDTFGHPVGDEVLKTVAQQLHAPWLKGCCAARLGGDEFAVIVDDVTMLVDTNALIARLERELCVSTTRGGLTMETGASVGLSRFDPSRIASLRDFVHEGDAALYTAKRRRVGDRRAA